MRSEANGTWSPSVCPWSHELGSNHPITSDMPHKVLESGQLIIEGRGTRSCSFGERPLHHQRVEAYDGIRWQFKADCVGGSAVRTPLQHAGSRIDRRIRDTRSTYHTVQYTIPMVVVVVVVFALRQVSPQPRATLRSVLRGRGLDKATAGAKLLGGD